MNNIKRYAIYWTPEPLHPLWRAGCEWLGRDPAQPTPANAPRQGTATPARYGFHATLKPPMHLSEGVTEQAFMQVVQACAAQVTRFAMPPLSVQPMGDFIALRPQDPLTPDHPLNRLAEHCVRSLDGWRAPPSEAELARRLATMTLSPAQHAALRRWGYPHVFEHWRFHMTLSDTLPRTPEGDDLRARLMADARRCFAAALAVPQMCESLSVLVEPAPGAPFVLLDRWPLGR